MMVGEKEDCRKYYTKEAKKEAETIINKALPQITQISILKSITELVQTK